MNLLRDFPLLRALRRLGAGRPHGQRAYTVTVPAPLPASNVVELRRPAVAQQPPQPLPRAANA
jgi:hypothetical protein